MIIVNDGFEEDVGTASGAAENAPAAPGADAPAEDNPYKYQMNMRHLPIDPWYIGVPEDAAALLKSLNDAIITLMRILDQTYIEQTLAISSDVSDAIYKTNLKQQLIDAQKLLEDVRMWLYGREIIDYEKIYQEWSK